MRFSYRRYKEGDASAINELYFRVTGRKRTVEQHAWQWLKSPAGESEMWLIEATLDDGSTQLIGHHGVMAEEFSYHGKDIRVGKTENTMVLPEFRQKLLYPRFEKKFLDNYESKFDALFSTMGPAPAIRLREAMGYKSKYEWKTFYAGVEPILSTAIILGRLFPKERPDLIDLIGSSPNIQIDGVQFDVIKYEDSSFNFDDFWKVAGRKYGITPKRSRANLKWRFWNNPYHTHVTLKITSAKLGTCISVVSCENDYCLFVNDLFTDHPENTDAFYDLIYKWVRQFKITAYLQSNTTNENIQRFNINKNCRKPWIQRLLNTARKPVSLSKMPRKITVVGQQAGLSDTSDWYVTPFYFEGR
jgi:hypothetical protein